MKLCEIVNMKKKFFKKYVIQKVKNIAFLICRQMSNQKVKKLNMGLSSSVKTICCQIIFSHFQNKELFFSYRTRMNKLKYNFKGKHCEEKCKCGQELTNLHLYECRILNNSLRTVTYSKLFDGRLCEMKYIIGILKENMKIHEEYTQDQDSSPLSH